MTEETLDVVDESGVVTGSMPRSEAERLNHAIPNVLIFLFKPDGKVWIQKRAKNKKHFPGIWDISACGAVASGENPLEAALRETFEETGIKTELKFVETFMNIFPGPDRSIFRRLSHLYIGETSNTPKVNDEVEEFKAVNYKKLLKLLKKKPGEFTPSFQVELEKAAAAHLEQQLSV